MICSLCLSMNISILAHYEWVDVEKLFQQWYLSLLPHELCIIHKTNALTQTLWHHDQFWWTQVLLWHYIRWTQTHNRQFQYGITNIQAHFVQYWLSGFNDDRPIKFWTYRPIAIDVIVIGTLEPYGLLWLYVCRIAVLILIVCEQNRI